MNWDQIAGKWEQMKADVKSRWGKLSDDDLAFVSGKRDKLVGKIQERYGVLKEQAQKDVDEWIARATARLDKIGESHRSSER
jgi:uncharacterized protein YjbJ (UPF0337 family)